jgi:hypothetical protein
LTARRLGFRVAWPLLRFTQRVEHGIIRAAIELCLYVRF